MKYFKIFPIILLLILASCQREEIIVPDMTDPCIASESTHPRSQAFQEVIQRYADQGLVGLSANIYQPKIGEWNGAMGFAEIENQVPMQPCHHGYAASIIKTFISVFILQLEEEGKLSLDDELSSYVDEEILNRLPNGTDFTIRHLLQNRSGMPDVFEVDFVMDFLNHPHRQYTKEELLRYLYGVSPVSAPGESYYYGDGNFILLSMVIEQLTGDLSQAYLDRIFDKIGLTKAHLIEEPEQIPEGVAASYWDRFGTAEFENVSDYQIALAAGLDGTDGLILTVADLRRFSEALMNEELISATSYQKMTTFIEIPSDQRSQNYTAYGLGIAQVKVLNKTWIGSFGNHVGSGAIMLYNPEDQTSISILQNAGTFFNDPIKQVFFYQLILELEEAIY